MPKRRALQRLLRSYTAMARKEHFCDNCCKMIFPGDFYTARVYTGSVGKIIVMKEHHPLVCFPPEEPIDDGNVISFPKKQARRVFVKRAA